jgi:diacylglycerol kinase (ATP)
MSSPLPPAPNGEKRPAASAPANPQKQRRGLNRLIHASSYSLAGLRQAWHEPAFRQEALLACVLLPLGWWLGDSWVERVLLIGSVLLVLIVELLNTAVESAIDRIGPEWHELSGRSKDMGSAAVLLALLLCALTWLSALWSRLA